MAELREETSFVTPEDEFVIKELIKGIIENLKKESEEIEDSYEQYHRILQLKVLSQDPHAMQRAVDGYKVLLAQLSLI